uniref:Uncharacterized protein n=1 Tax=Chenopodium quinoa TaxID=63459 RepID=A0A803N0M5_CHEQI
MAANTIHLLLVLSLVALYLSSRVFVMAEDTCPYPCNPPPIAGTITPPTPTTQTPPTYTLPPPSGNLPNYPPPYGNYPNYPPSGSDGGGSLTMPPPPDAILPYFPYYYRNGAHRPSDQYSASSSMALTAVQRSTPQSSNAIDVIYVPLVVLRVPNSEYQLHNSVDAADPPLASK